MDPTLVELFALLVRLSLLAFGGVATIFAELEREVVAHGWMSEAQFMDAFAVSRLAPGPDGPPLAILIGYAAAGVPGAAVALLATAVPGALLALAVTAAWDRLQGSPWSQAVRVGLAPLAIGLILASSYSLGRTFVRDVPTLLIAVTASVVLLRTKAPTLAVLAGAAALGSIVLRP
jgi:chromate transporter